MHDQLVIDSSGAWVRKTAQLIAEKPLLPPEHFGGLPCAADQSSDFTNEHYQDTYTLLLD
jgi:hypothetical protein